MNKAFQEYRRRTRQTPAMKTTDGINRAATIENGRKWADVEDKLALCSDLLLMQDVRATLTTDEGERNCLRLERKLEKLLRKE
mgnify:CR=1 FL=1|jgi:hypothetical protein|tara:strand:- start:38 stop:286 length:249 start_codon:yes stop_codon:yes gene_type:complete